MDKIIEDIMLQIKPNKKNKDKYWYDGVLYYDDTIEMHKLSKFSKLSCHEKTLKFKYFFINFID